MIRIGHEGFGYKLSDDEFKEMLGMSKKGIIAFKVNRPDSITRLTSMLESLIAAQRRFTVNSKSQKNILEYAEADNLAKECIEVLKPFAQKKVKKK